MFSGTSILARAVLVAHNSDKIVYAADSFRGLPKASVTTDTDIYNRMSYLRAPVEEVQSNFERFQLFDENKVRFLSCFI